MNNIKCIIVFLAVLLLTGCYDFLEKEPLDTINTSNYWVTEEDAVAAINGAYQPLQWPKLYNMRMWTSDIMAGNSIVGAGGGTDGVETQDMQNFNVSSDNPGVLDLYRGPAPGILRTNLILENVPDMEINPDIKERILGEAHFLRAHYYFILVRFFGDVPLVTEPQYPGDDLLIPRSPKEQIYDLIISDLEQAMNLLPPREEYSSADAGRASLGSATGLLAKVHLTLGNWDLVVQLTDQVRGLGYRLNPDYGDNFDPLNGNSQESLFEIQYSGKTSFDFWSDQNQASWLSTFTGPRNSGIVAGGWGWNQPTQEFIDVYEEGDLRKNITILYEGGPDFDGHEYNSNWSYTGYNLRKFLVPISVADTFDDSPMNFPVLRYADILLMEAEALNELGRTTDAERTLNLVRSRAGLDEISGLNQEKFREAVLNERRVELAFEGQWWFDLIRVDDGRGKGQWGLEFLHSIGRTNATESDMLFPIPQAEIDSNPNLIQNPGY